MKVEKAVLWFMNLLLAAAFAFAVLVLLEQLPAAGWPWYSRCLLGAPVLLCFLAGLCGRGLKALRIALLPISCVAAGVIMYFIFPDHQTMDIVFIVLAMVLGGGLYFIGLRGDEPFPPKVALASIILYLAAAAFFFVNTDAKMELLPIAYCALLSFLLSLYSFNASSLQQGVHNIKGGTVMALPAGLRSRNVLMLTIFLLVAVPLASLDVLHVALTGTLGFLFKTIANVIVALLGREDTSTVTATPRPTDDRPDEGLALEAEAGNPVLVPVLLIVMFIVGVLFLIAVFVGQKSLMQGRGKSGWFKRLFRVRKTEAYEDSIERLMDWKGFLRSRREEMNRFIERLTFRPQRFEEMPDDRMRVRFAYKSLLNSHRVNHRAVYYTPNELAGQLNMPDITAMTDAYNAVRYNPEQPVPTAAGEVARVSLQAMKTRGKGK